MTTYSTDLDNAGKPAASPFEHGRIINERYQVQSKLGIGGYGTVLQALDTYTDRLVALKIFSTNSTNEDPQALARMRQEAEILRALDHPNIVVFFGIETSTDGEFMVLEFIPGQGLDQIIKTEGAGTTERVLAVARQLLDALHTTHTKNILHRDIKPENILITSNEEAPELETAKIIDFGVAKAFELLNINENNDGVTLVKTRLGGFVGTPRYTAPEQAVGDPVGPGSDLFCLALVLYEWLTATPLISTTRHGDVMLQLVHPDPFDLSQAPERWRPWLEKMLQKDPSSRFSSANEALIALNALFPKPSKSAHAAKPLPIEHMESIPTLRIERTNEFGEVPEPLELATVSKPPLPDMSYLETPESPKAQKTVQMSQPLLRLALAITIPLSVLLFFLLVVSILDAC